MNLTKEQALDLYPEAMENISWKSPNNSRLFFKTILDEDSHQNQLIIDSGADTSGIGGTEWVIDEITERSVDVSGYNNYVHNQKSKIGSATTAVDLPDDRTILIKIN